MCNRFTRAELEGMLDQLHSFPFDVKVSAPPYDQTVKMPLVLLGAPYTPNLRSVALMPLRVHGANLEVVSSQKNKAVLTGAFAETVKPQGRMLPIGEYHLPQGTVSIGVEFSRPNRGRGHRNYSAAVIELPSSMVFERYKPEKFRRQGIDGFEFYELKYTNGDAPETLLSTARR